MRKVVVFVVVLRHLDGGLKLTGSEHDVLDTDSGEGVLSTEHMGAGGLVADCKVEGADLIEAESAGGVLDIVEGRVLSDPGAGTAAGVEVHGVGGHQGELAAGGLDDVFALIHGDELVVGVEAAASYWLFSGRLASVEVVPGVVGDVVCSTGGVELEKVDRTSIGSDLDAHGVTPRRHRPVGSAVGIDMAAEDTD